MKTIIIGTFVLLSSTTSFCQRKLVLKPGLSIGYGFNHIKDKRTAETSFASPRPGFTMTLDGRIEYYLNNSSFIDLAIKGSEAAFSFGFSNDVFKTIHQTSVEYTQINLSYNRFIGNEIPFFKKLTAVPVSIRRKISLGLGFNKNRSYEYYKEYFYQQYLGESATRVTWWRLYTATPDHDFGVHLIAKAGFSIYRNKRELFDLMIGYNKGIRNLTKIDLQYNINGTTYAALLGTRGSNIHITAGLPITLFHFQ